MTALSTWTLWWGVGGAIVLVAALLLIWILLAARGIEREARRALGAARRLEANTAPLWRLGSTRKALEAARHHVQGNEVMR